MSDNMSRDERIADPNVIIDRESPNTQAITATSQATAGGVPHGDTLKHGGDIDETTDEQIVGGYSDDQQKDHGSAVEFVAPTERRPGELEEHYQERQATVGGEVGCEIRETPEERRRARAWAAEERTHLDPLTVEASSERTIQPTDDDHWDKRNGSPYAAAHKKDHNWADTTDTLGAQATVGAGIQAIVGSRSVEETPSNRWPSEQIGQREQSCRELSRLEQAQERSSLATKAVELGSQPARLSTLDPDTLAEINRQAATLAEEWEADWTDRWFDESRETERSAHWVTDGEPSRAWIAKRIQLHRDHLEQTTQEAVEDIRTRGANSNLTEPQGVVFDRETTARLSERAEALKERWELEWSEKVFGAPRKPSQVFLTTELARRADGQDDGAFAEVGLDWIDTLEEYARRHTIGGKKCWHAWGDDREHGVTIEATVKRLYEPYGTREFQVGIIEDDYGREAKITVWKGWQDPQPLTEHGIEPRHYEMGDSPATCDRMREGDRILLFNFGLGWYDGTPQLRPRRDVDVPDGLRYDGRNCIVESESELHTLKRGDGNSPINEPEADYENAEPGQPWELTFSPPQ